MNKLAPKATELWAEYNTRDKCQITKMTQAQE